MIFDAIRQGDAEQVRALLSADPNLATQFIAYVLSADGQATLKKWGFGPIK